MWCIGVNYGGEIVFRVKMVNFSQKSDFERAIDGHICILLDIIYSKCVYQCVLIRINCILCIVYSIFEYYKLIIIHYYVLNIQCIYFIIY